MNRQLTTFAVALPALVLPTVALAVAQGANVAHVDQAPVLAQIALFGQAFLPALAALIATRRLDWGFRRVPLRLLALAWLLPMLCVGAGYGVAWVTGLAAFVPGSPLDVLIGLVPGVVPFLVLALGEQLGWSSLLTVRLAETRGPDATALIVGLAWAAFHYPLMLFVPGAVEPGVPAAYAMAIFTVEAVALAFPLVWLRLRTGSIWPVLLFHATLNASIYFVAQPMTGPGTASAWLLGEGGLLTSAATVLVVLATARLWRVKDFRTPAAERPVSTAAA
ncbi:CPBP family intramembrane metalloprotease [Nonomuraea sp. NBC_00507]|uniref:CPBP family intramembrane glutamic endopeptidase n=1 Tax=Nonomuraea sp. NBC_00507 TaxID=2976002 RepID=UPI002E18F7DE